MVARIIFYLGIEMEHTLEQMIEQLGITAEELNELVAEKGPLDAAISLADAPFWNRAQAGFLAEAVENDGAWAIAADQLDTMFRE